MSGRLRLRALLVLIAVGVSVFAFARPAAASGDDDYYVNKINAIRASRGLGTLSVDGQLTDVARSWSQHMAGDGTLAHNPNVAGQVSGWRTLGENVGMGPDDSTIEAAFENSPHHFENMVDPSFNSIGVGVVRDAAGTYWVTEEFKQSTNSPKPAPAPRPAAPRPAAPRPVAPKAAPKPAAAPRPAPAPVHSAPVHAAAAPSAPVTTAVATTAPPAAVPLAVLGSNTQRPAAAPALGVPNPFSAANLTGLVALVVLGASMALVARVRVTRTVPPISG